MRDFILLIFFVAVAVFGLAVGRIVQLMFIIRRESREKDAKFE